MNEKERVLIAVLRVPADTSSYNLSAIFSFHLIFSSLHFFAQMLEKSIHFTLIEGKKRKKVKKKIS